jgi:hypothetical protein
MTATAGTMPWGELTRGRLRLRDRARLVGQFLLTAPSVPGEVLSRFGRTPSLTELSAPEPPPASPIATAAVDLCRRATSDRPWLLGHSVRSFQFGQLFAQRGNVQFDPEVLWVAALLHDIALADGAPVDASEPACFALRGAVRAQRLAESFDWPRARAHQLAAAIAVHINVRVSPARSAEGHLLNLGSALDVAGMRYRTIYSTAMLEAIHANPPGNFPAVISGVWNTEARREPGCRAAFLRHAGFGLLIKTSPLAEHTARGR